MFRGCLVRHQHQPRTATSLDDTRCCVQIAVDGVQPMSGAYLVNSNGWLAFAHMQLVEGHDMSCRADNDLRTGNANDCLQALHCMNVDMTQHETRGQKSIAIWLRVLP